MVYLLDLKEDVFVILQGYGLYRLNRVVVTYPFDPGANHHSGMFCQEMIALEPGNAQIPLGTLVIAAAYYQRLSRDKEVSNLTKYNKKYMWSSTPGLKIVTKEDMEEAAESAKRYLLAMQQAYKFNETMNNPTPAGSVLMINTDGTPAWVQQP